MAAKDNIITTNDIQVTAREVDFVTRFARNWEHLRDIMGIMRPVKKAPGTVLKSKYAEGTLQSGNVGEGEDIPYSKFIVKEKEYATINVEKFAKAVSIEAIKDHGYDNAVAKTDDEFLFQLQSNVTDRFYKYLNSGELAADETTWQRALAMAKGYVVNKFKAMHRNITTVVAFVNVLDVYDYIGAANITVQTAFGFEYVKDFMGYSTVFLLSDNEIPRGRVIATPSENIVLYYVDPGDSDFSRAGLVYTTDGETNLIGFHTQGNYNTAVSEAFAIMGLTLFAEYIDGVAVVDVDRTPTLGTLTVQTAAGTEVGDTALTVTPAKEKSTNVYKYKTAASTAPAVVYGQDVKRWAAWDGHSDITATDGHKITVVEADATGKALNAGNATVTAKTS